MRNFCILSIPSTSTLVLTGVGFVPQGHVTMSGDIFHCHNLVRVGGREEVNAIGIYQVEARDAANHPTMHRMVPTTKGFPAPNAGSAEVEKLPWTVSSFRAGLFGGLFHGSQAQCPVLSRNPDNCRTK